MNFLPVSLCIREFPPHSLHAIPSCTIGCPETMYPSVHALLAPLKMKAAVVDKAFDEDDIDRILERGEANAAEDSTNGTSDAQHNCRI